VFTALYEVDLYIEVTAFRPLKLRDMCDDELQKANRQREVKGSEFDVIDRDIANKINKMLNEPRFIY